MAELQERTQELLHISRMIISTSGREASVQRYRKLLDRLDLSDEVQYSTFVSERGEDGPIDPQEFIDVIKCKDCPCLGGAISKDIKSKIIPFLDSLDESAFVINSVNTVVNINGHLKGYNTDYFGFYEAVESAVKSNNITSAIIYGYGGVTYVVVHALHALGIPKDKIRITGRNLDKAEERARELGVKVWSPCICTGSSSSENADDSSPFIFVNSAPVTDKPLENAEHFLSSLCGNKNRDGSINVASSLSGFPCIVFDHEMPGQYLQDWITAVNSTNSGGNITYISGRSMYIPQMIRQWQIFLDPYIRKHDDKNKVDSILRELIQY